MSNKSSSKKSGKSTTKETKETSTKKSDKGSSKNSKKPDYSNLEKDTRLVSIDDWDWSRLVYSEPAKGEIPDGSGNFLRTRVQYLYDEKTIGPAIVDLSKHYCFGVQPDNTDKDGKILKDKNTGKEKPLRGYRVPIVLTNQKKDTPEATPEEQKVVDFFDEWRQEMVRYAIENKKALKLGAKKDEQIDAMVSEVLFRSKNDEGIVKDDVSPKLYANLIYYSKSKEVGTKFYGPGDKELNPLSMTGHFYIYPNIRFDSLFIAKGISLQHRLYDATVEPIARAPQKRLAPASKVEGGSDDDFASAPTTGQNNVNDMMESDDEGDASGEEDEDDD